MAAILQTTYSKYISLNEKFLIWTKLQWDVPEDLVIIGSGSGLVQIR